MHLHLGRPNRHDIIFHRSASLLPKVLPIVAHVATVRAGDIPSGDKCMANRTSSADSSFLGAGEPVRRYDPKTVLELS